MKPIAFILLLFAGLPGGLWAQSEKAAPVDFKGHLIGEGVADFLRIEPEAQQEVDVCRQHPARHSCDRLLAALKAQGRAEISTTNAFNFVLDGGKLVGVGRHAELVSRCPTYAEIVTSQTEQTEEAA